MSGAQAIADEYMLQRQQMVSVIEDDVYTTEKYIGKKSFNKIVMQAMNTVPRHEFVPASMRSMAYENRPLPIGHGQTISQPYIVALMTDLLQPQPDQRVLEIGTGSGYQAAVLDNVETRIADGYDGWPQHAPFDSIIVTAAISHIPPPLVQQLKKGGRMVIPVGTRFHTQYLTLVEKDMQGKITSRQVLPVAFVPFTGGH
jgi:protein-L-isoaspartate(D-aspartate) O-methyltransferase